MAWNHGPGNQHRVPHVLFIDDDPLLRQLGASMLRLLGFEASTAQDGREALRCLRAAPHSPVDLLITDLSMPGMSGLELIQQVHESFPDLPVIVCSGNPRPQDLADRAPIS